MNLLKSVHEGFQKAGEVTEKLIHEVAKEVEKNSTPTNSFIQEVQQLTCKAPSSSKSHPLFPLSSPAIAGEEPKDPREKLQRLTFQTGRERQRILKEEGISQALPLLMVETRIALALGDIPTAEQLSSLLMSKSREAATAKALVPAQSLVEKGELRSSDLKAHKPYLAIVSTDCGKRLAATPLFFKLAPSKQFEILKDVSRLSLVAEHRAQARTALLAYDEPRQLYHESRVALLEGNTPKARVLMMDLKEKTVKAEEPEIVLMREEAREILRTLSLNEIDSLIAFNEGITSQQKGNRYGWNIKEQLNGESRDLSLKRMRVFLENGSADTLEEAYALGRKKRILGKIEGALVPLFQMGTYEGLERLSHPEDKKRYMLETVETINNRDGSYAIAGKMLEDVFQDELRNELANCPKEKFQALRSEIDRENIEKEVKQIRDSLEAALDQRLATLQENDPKGFEEKFGKEGPSSDEKGRMIAEMASAEVEHRVTLKIGYHLLRESHDSGELKTRDAYADKAWTIYNDTFDPLDEYFNVAHATGDALKKEALFTAVTLPAGLGMGTLARTTVGGTSLVVRLAAQGGFRAFAAEGLIVGAGALAEGLTGLALNRLLKGEKITAGKAGMEFLSGLVSGSVGRLWSRGAKALKLDEAGLQKIVTQGGGRAEIMGRKIAGYAAPMTLSATQSTVLGEVAILFQDEPVTTSFGERLLGNVVKAFVNPQLEKGIHKLTGGKLEKAEENVWKRLTVARENYLTQNPLPVTESIGMADSLTKAGWTEKQIMEFIKMDPSLAPLVMPSSDKVEDLVKDLPGMGVKERDGHLEANPY